MKDGFATTLEELRKLKVAALRTKYKEFFGKESKSYNRQFLFRRLAWKIQAQSEGGLSERARLRSAEIAMTAIYAPATPGALQIHRRKQRAA